MSEDVEEKKKPRKKARLRSSKTRTERSEAREKGLSDRASVYQGLAGISERFRLLSQVDEFKAVRTCLTSLNRATTVGGAPLSCLWTIHGPTGGGKTALLAALMRSFQAVDGIVAFFDAEQAADTKKWFPALGVDPDRCLYFGRASEEQAMDPLTFEEVAEGVDGLYSWYRKAKKDGTISMGTPLLIGVDSVSKMVPKNLFKKLDAEGGDALRSGVGRLQALMNTAWMAEMGAKIADEPILFAIIAHEMEKENSWGHGHDFKVRGGGSVLYDAMIQARIVHAGRTKDLASESAPVVGKRHQITIYKNKHGSAYKTAHFYTSTGEGLCPMGFDRVREVVHEGILAGVVEGPDPKTLSFGSRLSWKGRRLSLKALYSSPEVVDEIARDLDSRFPG